MSVMIPYLTVAQPILEVLSLTKRLIGETGLQVEQTFDLQVARLSHAGCPCPHHGTDKCSCQMIVMLIRYDGSEPLTMVLHGSDGRTSISIIDPSGKRSSRNLEAIVRQTLMLLEIETSWRPV